ncbi:MAG: hypothetical protein V4671_09490 [Armatimonadota bacterium]
MTVSRSIMQGLMTRGLKLFEVVLVLSGLGFLTIWWFAQFTHPAKIPLRYVIGQVQTLDGTCFVPARENLTFDKINDREGLPAGANQEILQQMQTFRNFQEGKPPQVKYDFHFRTDCKTFSFRLGRRPIFWYSSETGVFRSTKFSRQWCVAPPDFQIRMRALRKTILETRHQRFVEEREATTAAERDARRDEFLFQAPVSPMRDRDGLPLAAIKEVKPIKPF